MDDSQAVAVQMKAGECLVFHCHMLHYSQGNLSDERDRRLMLCRYAHADALEVYNDHQPRLGRLLRGTTRFAEVRDFEERVSAIQIRKWSRISHYEFLKCLCPILA